jgi:hypothetical protein
MSLLAPIYNLIQTLAARLSDARAVKLDNLDATVGSRAPANSALDNAVWTDELAHLIEGRINAYLDVAISSRAAASSALNNATWTDSRAAKTDKLDANISTRAPASTALSDSIWTDARAAKLDSINATISSRASQSTVDAILSDTAALDGRLTAARASAIDRLDVTIGSRLSSADTRLNNLDTTISSRATQSSMDTMLARWTQTLATNLNSRVNDTISSRAPASTALSNGTWTSARAGYLDRIDTTVSSRLSSSDTRLNRLDTTVSSRLSTVVNALHSGETQMSSTASVLSVTIPTVDLSKSLLFFSVHYASVNNSYEYANSCVSGAFSSNTSLIFKRKAKSGDCWVIWQVIEYK